jgi:hypothetical protein
MLAIKELEKRTGTSQSTLVRDAMTLLLKENHLIES